MNVVVYTTTHANTRKNSQANVSSSMHVQGASCYDSSFVPE